MERTELRFPSGDGECAAWLYRPPVEGPVPCVVMAHGFSMTRHDGLPPYAEQLAAAGAAVLVFDHRHLGDSPGEPRQRFRISLQVEDWHSAVAHARATEGIDPEQIVLWGFSFSGSHCVQVASEDTRIAAILVLCPFLDGLARVLGTPPTLVAWLLPRAVADLAGRDVTIPVSGQPGAKAALTFAGEMDGFTRARGEGASAWKNEISPGVFATVAFHRTVRLAPRVTCPAWVALGERDVTASAKAIEKFAANAPKAELHHFDVDHFEAFVDDWPDQVGASQIEFLLRAGILQDAAVPT